MSNKKDIEISLDIARDDIVRVYESKRDELSPEVKSYLDNLFEQIKQLYLDHKIEVFNHKTFIDEAPIEAVRQLVELSKIFIESLQKGELPQDEQTRRDYYPRELTSIVRKEHYREVDQLDAKSVIFTLQALPDGRIVSGSHDKTIRIWTKDDEGAWSHEILEGHTDVVYTLQALPDGRIVSGSQDKTIRIWTKDEQTDTWSSEELSGHTGSVEVLQALPDGRIVSGSDDKTIRIWTKDKQTDSWSSEVLSGHTGFILTPQALPDGRIVSGSRDNTIRTWTKDDEGTWSHEILDGHTDVVYTLQALPDGRIVSGSNDSTIRIWDGEEVKE